VDNEALDDLVRRLTALVVKIDERDTHMMAMLANHDAMLANHDAMLARQDTLNERLTAAIERLDTLMTEVFHQRHNGRDA
jgi:hypothetical protein